MDKKTLNIVKGCQKGKLNSQRELYEVYSQQLFGVCLRYASNKTEAEDIMHDGFVKIYAKISQYKFNGSFEGWMRRIMVNTAFEKYRSQYKVVNITDAQFDTEERAYENIVELMTADEMIGFIQELSPKYRMVFNMYAIEGYSHHEIAEHLNISVGTSKSNLSRARSILQSKIKKYYASNVKIG